ncbi:MAG TPA: chemoreceptor glutamine deamidase CheD, partial [Lamprocystis sp. (in: g-proteobacteria)]|nr:chemoreceptor glutamine deamidase CheD [Lamprocystis sp. (in: g-proteobacteria)]
GEDAMLELVKALLDAGGQRRHLEANLFGGANLLADHCVVAARSVESARLFLRQADIPVLQEDVGGRFPRKIDFCPLDGRVRIKRLRDLRNDTIVERDRQFLAAIAQRP